jgi:hypothetical protein
LWTKFQEKWFTISCYREKENPANGYLYTLGAANAGK